MGKPYRFTVSTTIDFSHYIGLANVAIVAYDPTDFEITAIESSHGDVLPPEAISSGAWREVADEVQSWFSGMYEAAQDAMEDR